MSAFINNAEAIRTRLITAPAVGEPETAVDLTDIEVIVDRQKDVPNRVALAIGKSQGVVISILFSGFVNAEPNAARPRLGNAYSITVWSRPVLEEGDLPADDVVEAAIVRLWQWVPEHYHVFGECVIRDGGIVPDPKWLKYEFEVVIPTIH